MLASRMLHDQQGSHFRMLRFYINSHTTLQFWNVKIVSRRSSVLIGDGSELGPYVEEEKRETPTSLKEKQVRMEQLVYRIWT